MSKPKKEKFCEFCGNPITGQRKYCSSECRTEGKMKVLSAKKQVNPQKKRKVKKKFLSIAQIQRIGREHNLTYGETVSAIERGDIEV